MRKAIFITGTDTGVGKTVATFVLATLLKDAGLDMGAMKPVQCAGYDGVFLKKSLGLRDPLAEINPYFAPEPLSPHLAFARARVNIRLEKIKKNFEALRARHDVLLVEGAGGLLVPIKKDYCVADLIKDLGLDIVIVSRLGLGTINHTLLTVEQARARGLQVTGIIFNESHGHRSAKGIPEKTNPEMIKRLSSVPILGAIPHLKTLNAQTVLKECKGRIDLSPLLDGKKSDQGRRLQADDKKYLWHPFTQMKDWLGTNPLVIEEARGCYLKDTREKWYLDGVSSLWVNVHGHRHPAVDAAVREQLNKVAHSTLLGLSNVPAVRLAKELIAVAPRGLERVFYSDSGSTAVEIALKMAYQYWQNIGCRGKRRIVHFAHAYHGDTLGSVSVGGISLFRKVYRHLTFKALKWPTPCASPFGDEKIFAKEFRQSLKRLEQYLKIEHAKVAAVIVEPLIQAAAGMIVWPRGILRELSRLCHRHDVLLIVDEVATGFGRTGTMFACEQEGIAPDLMCLAKGISAGYLPLAATLTTQKIYDGFMFDYKAQKTFFHGHTYTGNPLACAAGLANLEVFRKERTLERLQPKIKLLRDELKKFKGLSHVGSVRQKGFMVGIELVKDKRAKEEYPWQERMGVKVCERVRRYGVILRPLGNVIVLMPPLAISRKEIKKLLSATRRAIQEVTEGYV